MSEALLRLVDVTKRFGGLVAVDNVSFAVREGEICGLIGPNGAGKTTLFNLIAGALAPSAGAIFIGERNVNGLPCDAVARLGVARAFQLVNLFTSMSVEENVLVGADNGRGLGVWDAITHRGAFRRRHESAVANVRWALNLVGIGHLAAVPVGELTYGQQRLVATARALAARPALLLLDEPAAGLSDIEVEHLCSSIGAARTAGVSVLIVEHNVPLVMRLCDRVVVMQNGATIADGPAAEVQGSDVVAEAYLGR